MDGVCYFLTDGVIPGVEHRADKKEEFLRGKACGALAARGCVFSTDSGTLMMPAPLAEPPPEPLVAPHSEPRSLLCWLHSS